MLIVLANWIVLCAEWLLCGNAICMLVSYLFAYQVKSTFMNKIIAGYLGVSIYAQIFSAIDSLGLNANLILLIGSILLAPLYFANNKIPNFCIIKTYIVTHKILFAVQSLFFITILALAATPVIYAYSGDMGFYHAQFIHWLEEYGTVPGLANLTMRFATCGTSYYTCALYSWNWMTGIPLRGVLPFLWMVSGEFYLNEIVLCYTKFERTKLSWWLKIVFLLITMFVVLEIDTYSSVHVSALISYIIIIKAVELLEKSGNNSVEWILLACLAVFNITVKLTVVPFILLWVISVVRLLIEKKIRQIIATISVCLMIVVPFFISNILISGYILFPQIGLDFFNVDWKFPKESVLATATMIKTARKLLYAGMDNWPDNGIPLSVWFSGMLKNWFSTSKPSNVYVINTIYGIMLLCLVVLIAERLIRIILRKTQFLYWQIELVLLCGVLYCLFLSPAPQYLMWCLPMFFVIEIYIHYYLNEIVSEKYKKILGMSKVIFILVFILGIIYLLSFKMRTAMQHDFVSYLYRPGYCYSENDKRPIGFATVSGNMTYENIDQYNVYYPTQGQVIWYEPFPGVAKKDYLTNNYGAVPRMRGETLNEGFYSE